MVRNERVVVAMTLAMHAAVLLPACAAVRSDGRPDVRPDLEKIGDRAAWSTVNAESRVALEDGKQVLRLAPIGGNRKGSNIGMALVGGVACAEGAIDVDLRGQGEG